MKKSYIDIPEGQVHYRTEGTGEPLLLIHQTPSSSDEYSLIIPILAKHFRVIAPDSMGFGMSDPPPRPFRIEDYARTMVEFLRALGIKKTRIMGHHTGASIAVEIAVSHPEMVEKMVLSGCPYYEPETRKERLSADRFKPWTIREDGSHIMERWETLRGHTPDARPEHRQRLVIGILLAGPRGEEGHQAVFQYDEQKRLPLIKCPVLLLSGTRDNFIKQMEPTKKLIPNCVTKVIDGADALIAMARPQEFTTAMLDFLR